MSARKIYFDDLLGDCLDAVSEAGIPADQQPQVIAALIMSDSLNGLRKALLQNQLRVIGNTTLDVVSFPKGAA